MYLYKLNVNPAEASALVEPSVDAILEGSMVALCVDKNDSVLVAPQIVVNVYRVTVVGTKGKNERVLLRDCQEGSSSRLL